MQTFSPAPAHQPPRRPAAAVPPRRRPAIAWAPGLGVCLLVAAAATALAQVVPLGSAPVLGIVLGLAVGLVLGPRAVLEPGVRLTASVPLKAAVVVLGAELPLGTVVAQGGRSLAGIIITVGGGLLAAALLGRRFSVSVRLRALIGIGTSICGASAIAAAAPVIEAEQTEIGYAVTTIFVFNVSAVLIFPPLGHALGLGPHGFGVFAGTAVNDLSSVVAAAGLYGAGALHTAVIVKLTRTLLIVPICVALGRLLARRRTGTAARSTHRVGVPRFLLAFLILAALCGFGVFPVGWAPVIAAIATALITLALAAVGLSIDVAALRRAGGRPLALGAVLWIAVSGLSLGCQSVGLL
ncbi:MAG TPA: putative sulfate exporter family transporter [Solirubrobacteraceae bacterium]|nr:putative sulfate exporter family transporter [Solirubrobacteraceae bacterium]